jgi:glycosyltransferase involved in cell wall biosynthesis
VKKKIIIITPAHPLRGGIAASGERLAQAFQAEGHEVKIYTFSLQYPNFLFPGKTQYSDEPKPQDLDIQVVINSVNPFNWLKVGRQIAKEKADLVICRFWLPIMGPSLGSVLRLVKRNKISKIIGLIDNIIPHEKRVGDRPFAQYFVDACDAFVVMSSSVKEEMTQFSDKPCYYTPHPIYDIYGEKINREGALKFLQLPDNQHYILFFGFIRKYKGLDILIEALGLLKKKESTDKKGKNTEGGNLKLLIAGEFYGDQTFYKDLIKTQNLENQVIIKSDYIPTEEVKYYFGAADVVVQPYRSATQSGISQIAYHFEKPMIVTNVGGLSEIVPHGEAGYVVEPTPQYIADAIEKFYQNDNVKRLEEGVRKNKGRFSWEAMVDVFLKA